MSKRVRAKARKEPMRSKLPQKSVRKTAEDMAKVMERMGGEEASERQIQELEFFVEFGFRPLKNVDLDTQRKKIAEERVAAEAQKRHHERSAQNSQSWVLHDRGNGQRETVHTCHHHCYHERPASVGSSGFTYDDGGRSCCHCGTSAPNPWENERR